MLTHDAVPPIEQLISCYIRIHKFYVRWDPEHIIDLRMTIEPGQTRINLLLQPKELQRSPRKQ